jgi:hypothetical protein
MDISVVVFIKLAANGYKLGLDMAQQTNFGSSTSKHDTFYWR